ncbi:unnamed protein product [Wickerhamomyces anomalus]
MEVIDGDLDLRIDQLNQKIDGIIDPANLRAQVENVGGVSKALSFDELSKLQQRDYEITQELQQLRELWVISTLLKETEVNLELFEFENVFDSLRNFQKKIKSDSLTSSLIIVDKLQNEHDRCYDLAIEKIKQCWNELIHVDNDSIEFNAEVEINGNLVQFENISDVIKTNNLQTKIPNSNTSHLIDQKLLNSLTESKSLNLSDNKISINNDHASIQDQIQSISNLVKFISFIPDDQQIINYISPRFFEWLKELITINIDLVYSDKSLQNQFLELDSMLKSQNFKRNDLQNWIKNELNEIAVENYLDLHIDQARKLVYSLDKSVFQNLMTREYKESVESKPAPKAEPVPQPPVDEPEDDWGWNDEDINVDDDDVEPQQEGAQDEDIQDDWGWDDDEEEQPKPKKKLVSKLAKKSHSNEPSRESTPIPQTSITYQTTKLPEEVNKIIKSYLSTQSKLPSQYHDLHYSKLNYLITGFYILISQEFKTRTKSSLLLYNDLTYLNQLSKFSRIVELKEQYLSNYIKDFQNDIDEHYSKLQGLDPSISSNETYKIIDDIQLIFTMFFKKLEILPSSKYQEILYSAIESFYNQIIESVFAKTNIGEIESEYLNLILTRFLQLKFPVDHNKLKNHSKLQHVAFIVNSHLKDIMESFYNAEFYDLSTMELIALIDKLFADSDLKRRSIEDIREIREAD